MRCAQEPHTGAVLNSIRIGYGHSEYSMYILLPSYMIRFG